MKGVLSILSAGVFVLMLLTAAGADETFPKARPHPPLSDTSKKGSDRKPPEEVIQNLELFENLPLLKEIDLFGQMQPARSNKTECDKSSSNCSKKRSSAQMNGEVSE